MQVNKMPKCSTSHGGGGGGDPLIHIINCNKLKYVWNAVGVNKQNHSYHRVGASSDSFNALMFFGFFA